MGFVFVPVLLFVLNTGEIYGPWVGAPPFRTMDDCTNALLLDENKAMVEDVRRAILDANPGAKIEKEGAMCMQQPVAGGRAS